MKKDKDTDKKPKQSFFAEKRRERRQSTFAKAKESRNTSLFMKLLLIFGIPVTGGLIIFYLVSTGRAIFDIDFFMSLVGKVFLVGLLAGVSICMLFLRLSKGAQLKFTNKIALWIIFFSAFWTILLILLPNNIKEVLINIFLRCKDIVSELL